MTRAFVLTAIGMTVAACGIHGPKGNDTGGIIPWSPEAEASALVTANHYCGAFGKYAAITSIRRSYGEYIVYECRFERTRGRAARA